MFHIMPCSMLMCIRFELVCGV